MSILDVRNVKKIYTTRFQINKQSHSRIYHLQLMKVSMLPSWENLEVEKQHF